MNATEKRIHAALEQLIDTGVERGAQVAVYRDGELIVDVWAGEAHPFTHTRVKAETLFPVFSVTKGIAATVIHRLAERGLLSYDLKIAEVWPEFGAQGKGKITLRHALTHMAGVPELPPGLTFAQMLDWSAACEALAAATPKWAPGRQFAYHAKTYGWLVGEIARRVDGRFFPELVRDEIAIPLGLETLHVGLRNPENHPIAFLEESHLGPLAVSDFKTLSASSAAAVLMPHQMNSREMQVACLPSSNGLMNARAIARHYAALLPGGVDGVELLPPARLATATQWKTRKDPAGSPATWGLGYAKAEIPHAGKMIEGFGHGGYGGSMGCAFPELRLAIGYTRNRLGPSGWEALIGALLTES